MFGVALAASLGGGSVHAQEGTRALPTLLIKGDVVSFDQSDPSAALLTVKDRYGFETPIYLTQETAISKGEQALDTTALAAGTMVEVEYNFDVNTAKRHAVSVKVAQPAAAEAAPAEPVALPVAAPVAEEAAPEDIESIVEQLTEPEAPAVAPEPAAPEAEDMTQPIP
jgi:hypothetical protein